MLKAGKSAWDGTVRKRVSMLSKSCVICEARATVGSSTQSTRLFGNQIPVPSVPAEAKGSIESAFVQSVTAGGLTSS